jgi:hypothetical protein
VRPGRSDTRDPTLLAQFNQERHSNPSDEEYRKSEHLRQPPDKPAAWAVPQKVLIDDVPRSCLRPSQLLAAPPPGAPGTTQTLDRCLLDYKLSHCNLPVSELRSVEGRARPDDERSGPPAGENAGQPEAVADLYPHHENPVAGLDRWSSQRLPRGGTGESRSSSYGMSNSPTLVPSTNVLQESEGNSRIGPSGSLESRTWVAPGTKRASTQLPVGPDRLDLNQPVSSLLNVFFPLSIEVTRQGFRQAWRAESN